MYLDARGKIGLAPQETVLIDDSAANLDGAAKCGIYPILIKARGQRSIRVDRQIVGAAGRLGEDKGGRITAELTHMAARAVKI